MIITERELNRLREQFPEHSRVKLIQLNDPYNDKLVPGELGTVLHVDDIGTIHVAWDCGSSLGVVYGEDKCERLSFDLMMCCLGNGTTLVNRAVWKNNDYKTIGHISNAGNINYRIDVKSIPVDAERRISEEAERMHRAFRTKFEALPEVNQYDKILGSLPMDTFVDFHKSGKFGLEHLDELREYYYSIS